MTVISEKFAEELCADREMRDAFLGSQTRTKIANQIRAIRNQRGWSQGEFARILGKPQSNVSRLESRDYGNFTLTTLLDLASAFESGLIVEFAPYEDFLCRTHDLSPKALQVSAFSQDALRSLLSEPAKIHENAAGSNDAGSLTDNIDLEVSAYMANPTNLGRHLISPHHLQGIAVPGFDFGSFNNALSGLVFPILHSNSIVPAPYLALIAEKDMEIVNLKREIAEKNSEIDKASYSAKGRFAFSRSLYRNPAAEQTLQTLQSTGPALNQPYGAIMQNQKVAA